MSERASACIAGLRCLESSCQEYQLLKLIGQSSAQPNLSHSDGCRCGRQSRAFSTHKALGTQSWAALLIVLACGCCGRATPVASSAVTGIRMRESDLLCGVCRGRGCLGRCGETREAVRVAEVHDLAQHAISRVLEVDA